VERAVWPSSLGLYRNRLHDYAVCCVFSLACWPIALRLEIRSEKVMHEDLGAS
jgi:hypothetical protein